MVGAEQRLRELPDDAGAAEPGERIVALERRDDRAVRERVGGPVVVGDDDLEPERARLLDLGDRRDAAVDGEHEVDAFVGEPRRASGRSGRSPPRTATAGASATSAPSSRSSRTASAVAQMPSAS